MSDPAARLRALTEAATPGKWLYITGRMDGAAEVVIDGGPTIMGCRNPHDAVFVTEFHDAAGEIADLIQATSHFLAVEYPVGTSHPADALADELREALAAVEARLGEPA